VTGDKENGNILLPGLRKKGFRTVEDIGPCGIPAGEDSEPDIGIDPVFLRFQGIGQTGNIFGRIVQGKG
jgi:hypothetical protein